MNIAIELANIMAIINNALHIFIQFQEVFFMASGTLKWI